MTPPIRYVLVQLPATEEMGDWIRRYRDREIMYTAGEVFAEAAAASPNAGRVTAEMLERATAAADENSIKLDSHGRTVLGKPGDVARAVILALGLQVDAEAAAATSPSAPAGCKQEGK